MTTTNHTNIEPSRFSNRWLDWGDLANLEFGNVRSLSQMVWDLWCFEDLEEKDDLINQ